jgi:hypothetical protein
MVRAATLIHLSTRLRDHARRSPRPLAADLRQAAVHLRRLASLTLADEAQSECDPYRRRQLEQEACEIWRGRHGCV